MIPPATPNNEAQRLDALHRLRILDTAAEHSYDHTVRFIAERCGVPIALVSLVDAQRQWFKARYGLEACETSRELSFCGHAILQTELFEVPDALQDERFADNPFVSGPPHIRFYAGVPLVDPAGLALGTLCVVDTQPRRLDAEQRALLRYCAEHISLLLAMRASQLALAEARDQALTAMRSKDRFLASVSHELRTPLHGILGIAQLLVQGLPSEQSQAYGGKLLSAGEHLLELVNELLDLSRIEAGQFKIEQRPFSPAALLDEVLALHEPAARAKGLSLQREPLPPNLAAQLYGDPLRLRQMLNNLLVNAIKFTETGEVRVRLSCRAEAGSTTQLRWEVIDTGPGIAPEAIERLFQPFSQLDDSSTRRHGGSGLGLMIVRQLARLMGGEAGVQSIPGKGSTFWFELQLTAIGADEPAPTPAKPQQIEPNTRRPSGRQVLIAEDSELGAELLQTVLERAGYRVSRVGDGLQAVEAVTIAHNPPDAVLMDCNMPILDGLEATRRIRAWEARQGRATPIPVIALTADAFEDTRKACLAAGMSDFLTKPLRFEELLAVLDQRLTQAPVPPAAAPSASSLPVLNAELALARLGGERELYLQFASAAAEHIEQDMTAIKAAMAVFAQAGDDPAAADALRKISHRFKGVLATLGAEAAQAACAALENAGRRRDLPQANRVLAELERAIQALRPLLKGLLAGDRS